MYVKASTPLDCDDNTKALLGMLRDIGFKIRAIKLFGDLCELEGYNAPGLKETKDYIEALPFGPVPPLVRDQNELLGNARKLIEMADRDACLAEDEADAAEDRAKAAEDRAKAAEDRAKASGCKMADAVFKAHDLEKRVVCLKTQAVAMMEENKKLVEKLKLARDAATSYAARAKVAEKRMNDAEAQLIKEQKNPQFLKVNCANCRFRRDITGNAGCCICVGFSEFTLDRRKIKKCVTCEYVNSKENVDRCVHCEDHDQHVPRDEFKNG